MSAACRLFKCFVQIYKSTKDLRTLFCYKFVEDLSYIDSLLVLYHIACLLKIGYILKLVDILSDRNYKLFFYLFTASVFCSLLRCNQLIMSLRVCLFISFCFLVFAFLTCSNFTIVTCFFISWSLCASHFLCWFFLIFNNFFVLLRFISFTSFFLCNAICCCYSSWFWTILIFALTCFMVLNQKSVEDDNKSCKIEDLNKDCNCVDCWRCTIFERLIWIQQRRFETWSEINAVKTRYFIWSRTF
jgi:hypothetical protein